MNDTDECVLLAVHQPELLNRFYKVTFRYHTAGKKSMQGKNRCKILYIMERSFNWS
jgi:hypothetical protein